MGRPLIYKKWFILLIILPLLSNCASFDRLIKPDPAIFTNVVFDTSYEETWKAIQDIARSESLPLHIIDKELGVIETQKILEFNKKRLYRQYVSLYAEIKKLSENFTAISVSYYISRYNPATHEWGRLSGKKREKTFLSKVKTALESG